MRFSEFKLTEAVAPNPEIVKKQQELVNKGYNLGPYGPKSDGVDGIVGPYTQAAMDAFAKGISPKDTPKPNFADVEKFDNEIGFNGGDIIKPVNASPGSPFGPRHGQAHNGTDFPVPQGTSVRAPQSGIISQTGSDKMNGNYVVVKSGSNKHFLLHLSQINVSNGQRVNKGEVVGLSGNTGHSTGPHLHWELHVAGSPVDPMSHIG
jgi:murein DD-endopeptidase MepM/ murein hydrolase activator NlpD